MEYILSPSILAADFGKLAEQIKITEENGAKYLHLDVMDGAFVPSISFGMPVIKSLRKYSGQVFDVHLMIEIPERYLEDFKTAGADIITVHAEATKHLHRTVTRIKELGLKAGVSLNPATPLSTTIFCCGLRRLAVTRLGVGMVCPVALSGHTDHLLPPHTELFTTPAQFVDTRWVTRLQPPV